MSSTYFSNIMHCEKILEQKSQIVLITIFLISYILFSFLFKDSKIDEAQKNERLRRAEEYLKKHEKEDMAFFIGQDD